MRSAPGSQTCTPRQSSSSTSDAFFSNCGRVGWWGASAGAGRRLAPRGGIARGDAARRASPGTQNGDLLRVHFHRTHDFVPFEALPEKAVRRHLVLASQIEWFAPDRDIRRGNALALLPRRVVGKGNPRDLRKPAILRGRPRDAVLEARQDLFAGERKPL